MAKMFYTLEEAAAKLGVSEDQVKQMAEKGHLQQFRDRDKLMFKREQVDELFNAARTTKIDKPLSLPEDEEIKLDDTGEHRASKTDTIDLLGETEPQHSKPENPKAATATGISVFDADEVEAADPMAQTQVTKSFSAAPEDELSLDSVGSGSGLLDLTRESDDTSLGAVELLEDIAPAGEGSDAKMASSVGAAIPGSSTGIFESAGGAESSAATLSSLEEPSEPVYVVEEEAADPVWDGFAGGAMFGVAVILIVGLIVVCTGMRGQVIELTAKLTHQPSSLTLGFGGLLVLSIVLGVVGLVLGKSSLKKPAAEAA